MGRRSVDIFSVGAPPLPRPACGSPPFCPARFRVQCPMVTARPPTARGTLPSSALVRWLLDRTRIAESRAASERQLMSATTSTRCAGVAMRNATPQAREAFPCSTIDARKGAASALEHGGDRPSGYWVEPCTRQVYPHAFEAYRRRREAEERPPARHRGLGPDVDRYVWRRWGARRSPSVEVQLTLRAGTSPRIRCLFTKILDAIR